MSGLSPSQNRSIPTHGGVVWSWLCWAVWQVSDRTREGLAVRRSIGLHLGRLPLGYCNGLCSTCNDVNGRGYCPLHGGPDRAESQRGRVAVPHPVDRHAISLIKDLYLAGESFREIAIFLNNNTVRLPDG